MSDGQRIKSQTGSIADGATRIAGVDPLRKLALKDLLADPLFKAELGSDALLASTRAPRVGPSTDVLASTLGAEGPVGPAARVQLLQRAPIEPVGALRLPGAERPPDAPPGGDAEGGLERGGGPGSDRLWDTSTRTRDFEEVDAPGRPWVLPATVVTASLIYARPATATLAAAAAARVEGPALVPADHGTPYKDRAWVASR